jgi:hypothetical protein
VARIPERIYKRIRLRENGKRLAEVSGGFVASCAMSLAEGGSPGREQERGKIYWFGAEEGCRVGAGICIYLALLAPEVFSRGDTVGSPTRD